MTLSLSAFKLLMTGTRDDLLTLSTKAEDRKLFGSAGKEFSGLVKKRAESFSNHVDFAIESRKKDASNLAA